MEAVLRADVNSLLYLLAERQINYTLVGGVALLFYVQGRNTADLDLIMAPADVDDLPWNATVQDRDFGRAMYGTVPVDLLLTTNPLFQYVQRKETVIQQEAGREIPCATARGLLLLKLYALPSLYRQGNLVRAALYEADIRTLLHVTDVADSELLPILAPHVGSGDLHELAQILQEQRGRPRFQSREGR